MKLSNNQIYEYAIALNKEYENCKIILPVRINFFLQKNISTIIKLATEIDEARISLAKQYGKLNSQNEYVIPPEKIEFVNNELQDLLSLEQEVDIHIFKLDDFNDLELTYGQMNAIMFMIEE